MVRTTPFPAKTACMSIIAAAAILVSLISCSQEPSTFLLKANHKPVGKVIDYALELKRVGTHFENEEAVKDIEFSIDAEITFTTQKILPGNIAVVLEEQKWDIDIVDDSGKVTRKTEQHAYRLQIEPSGRIVNFDVIGDMEPIWKKYIKHHYEQGTPIFPSEKVPIGHSWTQSTTVELEDGSSEVAATTYTIKGTATKLGYDCLIIEYKGNLVLPLSPDCEDSTEVRGIDHLEMNGLMYFAHKEGLTISSEERRRIIKNHRYYKKDKYINSVLEADEMISYSLDTLITN